MNRWKSILVNITLSVLSSFFMIFFSNCEQWTPDQEGTAWINNQLWKTNYKRYFTGASHAFFITNYNSGDSLVFGFSGEIEETDNHNVDILFVIKEFQLNEYEEIGSLYKKVVVLDGTNNYAMVEDMDERYNIGVTAYTGGVGSLYFKEIDERTHITLGGPDPHHPFLIFCRFHFTIEQNGFQINVENGRVEYSISMGNYTSVP